MDENVLAAMARWPDVPDVFGWLSLSERGQWRLHPQGDALKPAHTRHRREPPEDGPGANGAAIAHSAGEEISSPAIIAFMNRNYTGDAHGRWYFQNGPQRVFVRLDAAPYVLRTNGPDLALATHNGLAVAAVSAWVLDDIGHLYAQTEHGPGLVAGRDLPALMEALRTDRHESLASAMEHPGSTEPIVILKHPAQTGQDQAGPAGAAPLRSCSAGDIAAKLGFVRFPAPIRETRPGQAVNGPDLPV